MHAGVQVLPFFYITGNFVPCYIKTLRGDRTAAERKNSRRPYKQKSVKETNL